MTPSVFAVEFQYYFDRNKVSLTRNRNAFLTFESDQCWNVAKCFAICSDRNASFQLRFDRWTLPRRWIVKATLSTWFFSIRSLKKANLSSFQDTKFASTIRRRVIPEVRTFVVQRCTMTVIWATPSPTFVLTCSDEFWPTTAPPIWVISPKPPLTLLF